MRSKKPLKFGWSSPGVLSKRCPWHGTDFPHKWHTANTLGELYLRGHCTYEIDLRFRCTEPVREPRGRG